MTLGLKFLLIFDFKKASFRYVFSIAIMHSCETVWVKLLLSKGWMVAVRNYSKNTIMEKNKQGEGGRFKDNGFSGVKYKTWKFF